MRKKIKQLFKYRKLPKILKLITKVERQKLLEGLIDLQIAIYKLDQYLEENWNLKEKKLRFHWDNIYVKMQKLGYSEVKAFSMTSHIRRYQLHEQQLRENLSPTRLNKQYYYHYKSCDVRLIRQIISERVPEFGNNFVNDWRSFDLITEINDDVSDVFEDQYTINGNLFLLSILEQGIEFTEKSFIKLIEEILEINPFQPKKLDELQSKIEKWTLEEADITVKLVKQNCKILSQNNKIDSKLWSLIE